MADSIRDALTKAIDASETTPEPVETVQQSNDASVTLPSPETTDTNTSSGADSPTEASKAAPAGSSDGSKAGESTTGKPPVQGAAPSSKPTTPGGGADTSQPPPSPADQAPGSWKAAEKAEWDKIPPTARAAIRRREAEATRAFQVSTEARRHADEYQKVLHPFEPLIQARGITDPLNQVIKPILQIRAALEIGSPQQKAQLVANMVRDFGIDVSELDAAITNHIKNPGAAQAAAPMAPPPPSYRTSPELQPLFALAERLAQRSQAAAAEAVASVEELPNFEELREDMADIMERADRAGREITIQQAYDRAAVMNGLQPSNPQPAARQQVTPSEAAAILARSRKAASSVAGAPSVSPGKKATTLREQIESAVSQHSS